MAEYIIKKMNKLSGITSEFFFPQIDLERQTSLQELAEQISDSSSLTEEDILGAVTALKRRIARELGAGRSVKIDGIGTFTASLGVKKGHVITSDTSTNAQNIIVKGVNFRTDKELILSVRNHFHPVRSPRKSRNSSTEFTLAERLALAHKFLAENKYMNVSDYCKITGLLPSTARLEIKKLLEDPANGLSSMGRKSHRLICLA